MTHQSPLAALSSVQFTYAMEFTQAGLSVVSLKLDGSKTPSINRWKKFQSVIPTERDLFGMFRRPCGIGILGGSISGGVEIFDFDAGELFEPWRQMVEPIVCRLPVVETPSGGWHVYYRCQEIGSSTKIAKDPSRPKDTLIETRAEGGYVVAPGSAAGVHSQGVYMQVAGPILPAIPEISPQERCELFAAARTFDKRSQAEREQLLRKYRPKSIQTIGKAHPVIQAFNSRYSWSQILEPFGWHSHDGIRWTRPGKTSGVSASVVHSADGAELLTIFSGNAGPLSPDGSYRTLNKFEAWKALVHRGENSAAFRAAKQEAARW